MRKKNPIVEQAEHDALGQYLSEWPENKSFAQVLQLIRRQSDAVLVWEPFENYDGDKLAEMIADCADYRVDNYKEAAAELVDALRDVLVWQATYKRGECLEYELMESIKDAKKVLKKYETPTNASNVSPALAADQPS
jgi:hypothetical protein